MKRIMLMMMIMTVTFKTGICKTDGVTALVCLNMFPVHGTAKQQETPSPFLIQIGASSFLPNQTVNVTLSAPDSRPFIGVILNVHRQSGETDDLIGRFVTYADNKTKTGNCSGGLENYVTHTNASPVTKMEAMWIAPDKEVGNITFRATFMESFSVFWINVITELQSDGLCHTQATDKEVVSSRPVDIDLSSCGTTMGCMLYPGYCSGPGCDMGVTYRLNLDNIDIQIWAWTTQQGYVSVGFSSDRLMGDDQSVTCIHDNGVSSFQYGINVGQKNYRQSKRGRLIGLSAMYQDGRLHCSFTIPTVMNTTQYSGGSVTYDLTNPHHVMLATGRIYDGTDVMIKHDELPITSLDRIRVDKYAIHRASALPLLTQMHGGETANRLSVPEVGSNIVAGIYFGILMLLAWILFVGIATVIARYYKPMFPGKLLCGTNVWFQIHRSTAVVSFVLTAASFAIIFVKVDGLSDYVGVHGWLGIGVMSGVTLQLLGGLLRPNPDSRVRPMFNLAHRYLGKSVHALAAATCLVVFNAGYLPRPQGQFGTIMLCIWIGVQVTWEILFEVINCRTSDNEKKAAGDRPAIRTVMLWCYISTMVTMLIPACMTIFLF